MKNIVLVGLLFLAATLVYANDSFSRVVRDGSPMEVRTAIDAGADVNARDKGMTPLMWAARNNENPAVIQQLVDAGADVNARHDDSWTPLMRAAFWNENPAVIQVFLDAGANVNARDSNDATPLMLAAHRNRNPAVVEVLVDAGADVTNEVWERIQQNKALRETDVYGRVAELRLE